MGQLSPERAAATFGSAAEDGAVAGLPWLSRSMVVRAGLFLLVTTLLMTGLVTWAGAGDVLRLALGVGPGPLLLATLLTLTLPINHTLRLRAVLGATGYEVSARRSFWLVMRLRPLGAMRGRASSSPRMSASSSRDTSTSRRCWPSCSPPGPLPSPSPAT